MVTKLDPLLLWAKTQNENDEAYLPLSHHLYDVAAVAKALLQNLPKGTITWLARQHEVEEDWLLRILIFLCGIHDIGKATPYFQIKSDCQANRLRRSGLTLDPVVHRIPAERHGEATYAVLADYLADALSDQQAAHALAQAIGAHHGTSSTVKVGSPRQQRLGTKDGLPDFEMWKAVQLHLITDLAQRCEFEPREFHDVHPCLLGFLAGLCSVADWIGSDQSAFPVSTETCDVRWDKAAQRAETTLGHKGLGKRTPYKPRDVEALFPFTLNPIQQHARDIIKEQPRLVLIEALTGDGKTEAAMILAEYWRAVYSRNGAYFALPTQATSNQMFGRVVGFLQGLPGNVQAHLLHGKAIFSDQYQELRLGKIIDDKDEGEEEDGRPVASEWLVGPKRGLLGEYGVGTIDQALLASLKAKHGFIRLFALARKTIILDEVHAYDLYMSEILDLLLQWLSALDCTVVLLSATLPAKRRAALLRAFGATSPAHETPFPRVTHVGAAKIATATYVKSNRRLKLKLRWRSFSEAKADAVQMARAGQCVAIICNTVATAQATFLDLEQDCLQKGITIDLFHSRFPFEDRQAIEDRCLSLYGKNASARPNGSILIATQVVEQSLDLDFDVMISELAPVDLLIQRAGRLQRHQRRRTIEPTLFLINPEQNVGGAPNFGGSSWVYDESVLIRTLCLLIDREGWDLPDQSDELIEAVYGEPGVTIPQSWEQLYYDALTRRTNSDAKSIRHAEGQKIKTPDSEDFIRLIPKP